MAECKSSGFHWPMKSAGEQKQAQFAASSRVQAHLKAVGAIAIVVDVVIFPDNDAVGAEGTGRDRQHLMVKNESPITGRTVRYGRGEPPKSPAQIALKLWQCIQHF